MEAPARKRARTERPVVKDRIRGGYTEADIKEAAGATVWAEGQDFYLHTANRFSDLELHGDSPLTGEVRDEDLKTVSVEFLDNDNGLAFATCTCGKGWCQHSVALLLHALHNPDEVKCKEAEGPPCSPSPPREVAAPPNHLFQGGPQLGSLSVIAHPRDRQAWPAPVCTAPEASSNAHSPSLSLSQTIENQLSMPKRVHETSTHEVTVLKGTRFYSEHLVKAWFASSIREDVRKKIMEWRKHPSQPVMCSVPIPSFGYEAIFGVQSSHSVVSQTELNLVEPLKGKFPLPRVGWAEVFVKKECSAGKHGHPVVIKYIESKAEVRIKFSYCVRSSIGRLQWPLLACGCISYENSPSRDAVAVMDAPNE